MKKGKLIQLRISEREKNIIQEKATSMEMSISDYIRYVATSKKIQVPKKVDLSKMQECILDVDYSIKDNEGKIFFVVDDSITELTEDIKGIQVYHDKTKGYFLADGRSINEITK